jgi:hypothetical protein
MKSVRRAYIDYWQVFSLALRGLKNRFGIRVGDGRCWALIQIADDKARTFGKPHAIPVDLSILPSYFRLIVDEHRLIHPKSDLLEVLAGTKTFEEVVHSPKKIEPKRSSVSMAVRLSHAS